MRFGKNPNEPETGVNLRQHVIRGDTEAYTMKTGETEHRTEPWRIVEDGYRVIARRPRSEICDTSIDPERADEIEEFTHGIMPLDRW
jgi:hypothetical protein